jgi:hypothetical protein
MKNKLLIFTLFLSLCSSSFVAPAALRRLVRPRNIKLAVAALGAAGTAVGISKLHDEKITPVVGRLSSGLAKKVKSFAYSAPVLSFAKNFYVSSVLCDQDLFEGYWLPDEKDKLLDFISSWRKEERINKEALEEEHGTKKAPLFAQELAEEARVKLRIPKKLIVRVGNLPGAAGWTCIGGDIFVSENFDSRCFTDLRHIIFHEASHQYQYNRKFFQQFNRLRLGLLGFNGLCPSIWDYYDKFPSIYSGCESEADYLAYNMLDCWMCSMQKWSTSMSDSDRIYSSLLTRAPYIMYLWRDDIHKIATEQKKQSRLCFLHNKIAGVGFNERFTYDHRRNAFFLASSSVPIVVGCILDNGYMALIPLFCITIPAIINSAWNFYKEIRSFNDFHSLEDDCFRDFKAFGTIKKFEEEAGKRENPFSVKKDIPEFDTSFARMEKLEEEARLVKNSFLFRS